MTTWRYMCERAKAMAGFTTCEFCHKQIPAPHDCPERRGDLVTQAQALDELPTVAEILWPPETEEESDNRAIAAMVAHLVKVPEQIRTFATTGGEQACRGIGAALDQAKSELAKGAVAFKNNTAANAQPDEAGDDRAD